MSAYLIETRASGFTKQTVYKTGDKFAAQAYTEDLPTGESTEKFTADPVTRVKDQKDPGYVIRCALLVEADGLQLVNTKEDPADLLEQMQAMSRAASFGFAPINIHAALYSSPKIFVPRDYLERKNGIRLLTPYRRFEQYTVRIKPV